MSISPAISPLLSEMFGDRLQTDVSLKRYTAARIGGIADVMIRVESSAELAEAVKKLWLNCIPFIMMGSGSNVLVADAGVRQVVILNQARQVKFNFDESSPSVWAESGANFGSLARKAADKGLSGLEWAAGIPGTVGGAVYGNAGAHGADMSTSLIMATILHRKNVHDSTAVEIVQEDWEVARFEYAYRSSILKRQPGEAVVLAAQLKLSLSTPDAVKGTLSKLQEKRQLSQPSGASLGSIFKNPPGDYAGRLIETAGLKGTRIGGVEISPKHANFFINHANATASDYAELIKLAQDKVMEKFGTKLELEIELIGDWNDR